MSRIMGIDLGTTNTVMAILEGDHPVIIPNNLGERLTPSIVSFSDGGEILVGKNAKRASVMNPERTVFSIKRHMGTNFRVKINEKSYTPQEISAIILQKMKQDMEDYLGEEVSQAVITVPAYFTDTQRQATRDAGEIAGLTVRRIIDEPTSAAIAYGMDKKKEDQILMVFDLGGGTFDVSIIEVVSGVFQVLAIKGNTRLGGDDFDMRLAQHLLEEFKEEHGVDLSEDKQAMQRLRLAAEEAKIELTEVQKTNVLIDAIAMSDKGPLTLDVDLTRAKFESLIEDFIENTCKLTLEAIEDAGLKTEDITNVLMVGGSTRIPLVQKRISETLNKQLRRDVQPEECVAMGSAIQSSLLASIDEELELTAADRTKKDGPVVIHLTPFSLGVGLVNDQYGVIIDKNATYPTESKDIFTTTRDFQNAISFPIYEGEEQVASANTFLDMLRIDGITPAPRGIPRIEVNFRLNHDRILEATAIDIATGNSVSVTVEATDNRLSNEEKARMTREARQRVTEMLEQRMRENLHNQAESLLYRTQRLIGDSKDEQSQEAQSLIERLQKALDEDDHAVIQVHMEALTEVLHKLEAGGY